MVRHECSDQFLYISNENNINTYHSENEEFCATFTFTCKFLVDKWIMPEDVAAEPEFHRRVCRDRGRQEINIDMDGNQFFNIKNVAEILRHKLQHWPLPPNKIDKFIRKVLRKSSAAYVSMLDTELNRMRIYFPVTVVHNHIYNERHVRDLTIRRSQQEPAQEPEQEFEQESNQEPEQESETESNQEPKQESETESNQEPEQESEQESDQESEEEEESLMVPTAEYAIESLKRMEVSVDSSDNCTVCFEEIKDGCEAMAMPCSHVFHEDCIKPWLKTSHYCPLCRFEMPIDCSL